MDVWSILDFLVLDGKLGPLTCRLTPQQNWQATGMFL